MSCGVDSARNRQAQEKSITKPEPVRFRDHCYTKHSLRELRNLDIVKNVDHFDLLWQVTEEDKAANPASQRRVRLDESPMFGLTTVILVKIPILLPCRVASALSLSADAFTS